MTAHGEDATLTFKVLFDRVVTVTGAPTLKLDLWGETRNARYVSGSGTDMLTFTWGPVSTGDNDFDGIEVKALVLAGASIVDAGNAESMFVAESFGGEHFPQHKIFGGFHEMWIEVDPEAEAVEGERYTFSVRRSIGESRDPESHYVLLGITDSAFPGVSASGRYEEAENGPGGRAVTFDQMASEGRRANTEESSLLVIPPVHEDTAGGRTMTIALLTTHFTVRNEHGELAHRIYMPRNLEGVTVPVRVSVSGRRPATVTVSMASTPRLKSISTAPTEDTYGRREIIEIAVTASEAVEVIGDPVFRFTIGADPVRAAYDRVNSTATRLLFTYTVQAGDMGPDGISIGDGSTTFELDSNDRIRTAAQRIDIDRSHPAPGTLSGHKVDGSRIADNTAPALVAAPDGATVFTDELTLTYDEALDAGSVPAAGAYEVTATNGGVTTPLPVSAVAVDGSEVTLTLATPALLGQTVTLTYTVPATNPLRDLFGNPAGALTNHPVTNETTRAGGAAGGVDRGGACEGGAVAGRCGVPADGVAGPGGGPRGHALDRAGGGVSREHGADRHDSGGPDLGNRDVPDCQRRHPRVGRPDRHGHGRRAPLRAGGGAGQRGDGPGGGGGPADRRAVGRGRLRRWPRAKTRRPR